MADAPTAAPVLAAVVPVLVGGLLTLLGGAGMQWYLHRDKTREERRTRRGVKFEELVSAVYDHEHWLDEQRNARLFGEPEVKRISPLSRIEALCAVYFPEFDAAVEELNTAARQYERWMIKEAQKRLRGAKAEDIGEGFDVAYDAYLNGRKRMLDELYELRLITSVPWCDP